MLEVDEIERSRKSGALAPDLNIPGRGQPTLLAGPHAERRAAIKCLSGKPVQPCSVIGPQIARLGSQPYARRYLRRERRPDAERWFLLNPTGCKKMGPVGIEQQI